MKVSRAVTAVTAYIITTTSLGSIMVYLNPLLRLIGNESRIVNDSESIAVIESTTFQQNTDKKMININKTVA